MREKTQCPNCGSYYTQITRWYGDPITRTRFSDPERWWNKYLLRYRIDSSMGDVETLLRGGARGLRERRRMRMASPERASGDDCHCNCCGYQWLWIHGTAKPRVTVRPYLIHKYEKEQEESRNTATWPSSPPPRQ